MERIDSGGRPVSIDHDILGTPAVAYFYGADLRYARPGLTGWDVQSLGSHGDYAHNGIDLRISPNGHPGIVYDATYATGVRALEFGYFDGLNWNFETIDIRGVEASIVFDSNGDPHVSYRKIIDKDHSILRYAVKTNGIWSITTIDRTTASYNFGHVLYTSIDIDSSGNLGISYGYTAGTTDLVRFAFNGGNGWSIQTVESNALGAYTSLRFDSGSRPCIAYSVSGTGLGKLAVSDGSGSWSVSSLPAVAERPVGFDLDFNNAGNPVISFRDQQGGGLWLVEGNPGSFSASQVMTGYSSSMSYNPMKAHTGFAIGNGVGLVFSEM